MKNPFLFSVVTSFSFTTFLFSVSFGQQNVITSKASKVTPAQAVGHAPQEKTLIGAAVGGMVGYIIGNEMDKSDQQKLTKVYETTPSGQAVTWKSSDKSIQYRVIPQPAYQGPSNQTCRKAEIVAVIDGKTERTYSTACRDAYGQWQLKN